MVVPQPTEDDPMSETLLPLRAVLARTSLSRSTVYRYMGEGTFPKPVALGSRKAWLLSEISRWIDSRIAERVA